MTPQTGPSHTPVSRRSLAMRLLFWFLLIALLPCGLLTAITASLANRALEETVRERLIQTAAARATQLEAYASERVQDGTTLARAPIVVTAVTRLREVAAVTADGATGQALQQAGADFNEFLTYVTASFGYRSLLLLDADGLVLYSIGGDLQPGRLVTDGSLATLIVSASTLVVTISVLPTIAPLIVTVDPVAASALPKSPRILTSVAAWTVVPACTSTSSPPRSSTESPVDWTVALLVTTSSSPAAAASAAVSVIGPGAVTSALTVRGLFEVISIAVVPPAAVTGPVMVMP